MKDPTRPSRLRMALIVAARAATYHLILRQKRFLADCRNPEPIQARLLQQILSRQAETAFGRDHGFATIHSLADYRRQVPVAPYERLLPYIERTKQGETDALIARDRLWMFALTSGTTAARKHIPITSRYLLAYSRGWNLWGIRAYRDHRPRYLVLRPIVQLVGLAEEYRTSAGIPCGNASGLTAATQRRLIRRLYVVPPEIGAIPNAESRYYVALRSAITQPVALFSAANPSTLVALARTLQARSTELIRDAFDGTLRADDAIPATLRQRWQSRWRANPTRARELEALANRQGELRPKDVWPPHTILLATWMGGSMTPYLNQLTRYYGDAPRRDLGLVASEGRFTIPFQNDTPAGILDLWSHVYEFIPEDEIESPQPTVLGLTELQEGRTYSLIPTTQAGLYRYDISDLVRVVGFEGRTPIVEFVGKGKRFSNLTGEKLSEAQVASAVNSVLPHYRESLGTYSLLPVWEDQQPYYALAYEQEADGSWGRVAVADAGPGVGSSPPRWAGLAEQVDQALRQRNTEYDAKRASGRLGPVRLWPLPPGRWSQWDAERLAARGGTAEQYKHPLLLSDPAEAERLRPTRPGTESS